MCPNIYTSIRPSKKTKIIRGALKLIVILIIIAAGLYIGYVIGNNQNKDEEKTDKKKTEVKEEERGWYEPTGTAKNLDIYGYTSEATEYSNEFISIRDNEHKEEDNYNNWEYTLLNTYKCTNSDCMLKNQNSNDLSTVIIKDGNYLVYNFRTNKAKKINFGENANKLNYIDNEEHMCNDL